MFGAYNTNDWVLVGDGKQTGAQAVRRLDHPESPETEYYGKDQLY